MFPAKGYGDGATAEMKAKQHQTVPFFAIGRYGNAGRRKDFPEEGLHLRATTSTKVNPPRLA